MFPPSWVPDMWGAGQFVWDYYKNEEETKPHLRFEANFAGSCFIFGRTFETVSFCECSRDHNQPEARPFSKHGTFLISEGRNLWQGVLGVELCKYYFPSFRLNYSQGSNLREFTYWVEGNNWKGPWLVSRSGGCGPDSRTFLFAWPGDTYPQKHFVILTRELHFGFLTRKYCNNCLWDSQEPS